MPSWPASMTNANTGARKHRNPTSSFRYNRKIRRACATRLLCLRRCFGCLYLPCGSKPSSTIGRTNMRFSIDVGSELELKLYQAILLYRNDRGSRVMATVHGVLQTETNGEP